MPILGLGAGLSPLIVRLGYGEITFQDYLRRSAQALAGGQASPMIFWFITCYWSASLLFAVLLMLSRRQCNFIV